MEIIQNRDLIWETDNYDVVLVGTTIYCALSDGLQRKMRKKYPFIDEANNNTPYADVKKLGTRLTIGEKPKISLCYIAKYKSKKEYIDYDALEKCIKTANIEFAGLNVVTTYMGATPFDGNGDKERIKEILSKNSDKMNLTIFDYHQMSFREENKKQWLYIQQFKKTDPEKYKQLWQNRKENWKNLYL